MQRFSRRRYLDEGGMGTVWAAWDDVLGREVALKVVSAADASLLRALKREFRAVADIVHPNLVQLYEIVETPEGPTVVMELVDGVDLITWLRQGAVGPLDDEGRARLHGALAQLIDAVETLHAHGCVHRDVKPSNVLVDGNGRVVVLDFGIAQRTAGGFEATDPGIAGTRAYMPPEAFLGQVSTATDWYAVGVLLAECLAGRSGISLPQGRGGRSEPVRLGADVLIATPPAWLEAVAHLTSPDPSTRADGAAVASLLGLPRGRHVRTRPPAYVGREAERRTLHDALRRVQSGQRVVVDLRSAPGLGKTALIEQFLRETRLPEVLSGRSACHVDLHLPFQAFDGLVDAVVRALKGLSGGELAELAPGELADLVSMFPALATIPAYRSDPPERGPRPAPRSRTDNETLGDYLLTPTPARVGVPDVRRSRERAFQAMATLWGRMATRWRLVFVPDDVHHADPDSLELLEHLLTRTTFPSLWVLATDVDAAAPAHDLLDQLHPAPTRLTLQGLDAEAARDLLRSMDVDPDAHAAWISDAAGSPLVLFELANAADDGGDLRPSQLIGHRASALSSVERDVLNLLVIAGAPIPDDVAFRALPQAEPVAALRLCRHHLARRVPTRHGMRLAPYDQGITRHLLGALDADAKRHLHRRLAAAWTTAEDVDPEVLFRHHDAAGDEAEAARAALHVAREAERKLAFHKAAEMYRVLIERGWPPGGPALRARHAEMLTHLGRLAEAAAAYREAARLADPDEARRWTLKSAESLLLSGHIDDGLAALASDLSRLGASPDRSGWRLGVSVVSHLLWLLLVGLRRLPQAERTASHDADPDAELYSSAARGLAFVHAPLGLDYALRGLRRALAAGDRAAIIRMASFLAASVLMQVPVLQGAAQRCLAASRRLAGAQPDAPLAAVTDIWSGMVAIGAGDWTDARMRLTRALSTLEHAPSAFSWECDIAAGLIAWLDQLAGDHRTERALVERYLRTAEDRGDRYGVSLFAQYFAMCELAAGRVMETRRLADLAEQASPARGPNVTRYYAASLRCLAALYDEDVPAAQEAFRQASTVYAAIHGAFTPQGRIDHGLLEARLALATRGPDGRERLARIRKALSREERPDAAAYAAWLGLWTADAADAKGAADALFHHGVTSASLAVSHQATRHPRHAAALRARGIADPQRWSRLMWPIPDDRPAP